MIYGLALEGGGAKGAYHIGAYKALKEMGIQVNAVVGTSIGALNAAMIAQKDEDKAYKLWYNIKQSTVFDMDDIKHEKIKKLDFDTEVFDYMISIANDFFDELGLKTDKIKKFVKENIDEDKLRKSDIDYGLVTYSLTNFNGIELFKDKIVEGKIHDYILASANFPLFKVEKYDNKYFIDGGVFNNLPINMLIDKGIKNIIAIKTNAIGIRKKVKSDNINIIYIEPIEDLGGILDFDGDVAKQNLLLGYYDAYKSLKNLKGFKYYFNENIYEKDILKKFIDLSDDKIFKLSKVLNYNNYDVKRSFFEKIIPQVASMLQLSKESSYVDIIITILESLAIRYNIRRFRIYDFEEMVRLIKVEFIQRKRKKLYEYEKLILAAKMNTSKIKEYIVDLMFDILFV